MARLPPLPPGKKAISQGYNLVATNRPDMPGSVVWQYREEDISLEKVDESNLTSYFWNDTDWQALDSSSPGACNRHNNLISAASRGPGLYVLLETSGRYLPVLLRNYYPLANGRFETRNLNGWQIGQIPFQRHGRGLPASVVPFDEGQRALLGLKSAQNGAIPTGAGYIAQTVSVQKR